MSTLLELPKYKLVRKDVRIKNPNKRPIIVWLEPWADRVDLEPAKCLDIIFIGPKNSLPEILPRSDEVSIYAWQGAEAIAISEGHLALPKPTLGKIIRQELEIGNERIELTDTTLSAEDIAMAQASLDNIPELQPTSALELFKITAFLTCETLVPALRESAAAANVLWQIANRIVATKGFLLTALRRNRPERQLWRSNFAKVTDLIQKHSVFALDWPVANVSGATKQRFAGSEPDSTLL